MARRAFPRARWRTCGPPSIASSSPASTTSSITAPHTRRSSDPWPGWQFYASVEFNPQNAWWDDFAALNAYVARVQSFMQSGRPDDDVLLYYPFYESLAVRGKTRLAHFGGAAPPAAGHDVREAAETLQAAGFTYDFVSDRQVRRLRTANGRDHDRGRRVVSDDRAAVGALRAARNRPRRFWRSRERRDGGVVDGWPADVSGLADLDGRRARFKAAIAAMASGPPARTAFGKPSVGGGRVLQGRDLGRLLARANVQREPMVDRGLQFARRTDAMGRVYFVSNRATARSRAGSRSTCVRTRSWRSIR